MEIHKPPFKKQNYGAPILWARMERGHRDEAKVMLVLKNLTV